MSYNLEMNSDNISINVKLIDTICIFSGDSGTGKTYLFSKIRADCKANGRKIVVIDDNGVDIKDSSIIINMCKDMEIVIFDRADLYLTKETIEGVLANGTKMILICIKVPDLLDLSEYGSYSVIFTDKELITKRWAV